MPSRKNTPGGNSSMPVSVSVLLFAVLVLSACMSLPGKRDQQGLEQAVATYERAVASADKTLFMSLLAPGDEEFLTEQSRWFDYRMATTIHDFAVRIESVEPAGPDEYAVRLSQSYTIGENREPRSVSFIRQYRRYGDRWLDADLVFDQLETAHFIVRFPSARFSGGDSGMADQMRLSAEKVAREAEAAWQIVKAGYGAAPERKTVIKLFTDRELLRQNSKITIGRLFSGWAEPGESIKLWLRPDPSYSNRSVLAHELVHKVTLSESANLCSWFAEGLANYYGSFPGYGGSLLDGGVHSPSDYDKPLGWLEAFDPDGVDNDADWRLYGGMAGTVIGFLADYYGPDTPRRLVQALSAWPQERSGYVWAVHDRQLRGWLAEAVQAELGLTMAELDGDWRRWIGDLGAGG